MKQYSKLNDFYKSWVQPFIKHPIKTSVLLVGLSIPIDYGIANAQTPTESKSATKYTWPITDNGLGPSLPDTLSKVSKSTLTVSPPTTELPVYVRWDSTGLSIVEPTPEEGLVKKVETPETIIKSTKYTALGNGAQIINPVIELYQGSPTGIYLPFLTNSKDINVTSRAIKDLESFLKRFSDNPENPQGARNLARFVLADSNFTPVTDSASIALLNKALEDNILTGEELNKALPGNYGIIIQADNKASVYGVLELKIPESPKLIVPEFCEVEKVLGKKEKSWCAKNWPYIAAGAVLIGTTVYIIGTNQPGKGKKAGVEGGQITEPGWGGH